MSDFTKFLIKAYVRKGLVMLGTYLLSRRVLQSGTAEDFASQYLEPVVGSLLVGGGLLWTTLYQWYVKRKIEAAKKLPVSTSSAELEVATKLG